MNQTQLIRRAFEITWRYRVLWIFGILLALTGGGGTSPITWTFSSLDRYRGFPGARPGLPSSSFSPGAALGLALLFCCLLFVVIIVLVIVKYVVRAAAYRMVDQVDENGTMPTWREGFRLGWTNRTLRLFLLNLIVGIFVLAAFLILILLAASPLALLAVDSTFVRVASIVVAVALISLVILFLIIAGVVISVLSEFWSREIILTDLSIGQAFTAGNAAVRARWQDVGVMWLLMFIIGIAYGIVILIILIPVLALAVAVGAGVGFAVYGITHSTLPAVLTGSLPFMLIMMIPLTFIGGLYEVFKSAVWTLTYRQVLRGPETPAPVLAPSPSAAGGAQ